MSSALPVAGPPTTVLRPVPAPPAPPAPPAAQDGFLTRAADAGVRIEGRLAAGPIEVDLDLYTVSQEGCPVEVSPRQVELLALFLAAPGRVWSREQLHWICWQDTSPSRRVDVQLCRIRGKLGLDVFRNIRDRGWALRPLAA